MIKNLALALVSLALFLLGAEAFCRIVRPDERWFADTYAKEGSLYQLLRYDPTIGWTGRPFAKVLHMQEQLNSRGLRGPEFPDEKAPNRTRIVALGDSCTFNVQFNDVKRTIPLVEIDDPYPAVLNLFLNRIAPPGRRYEVINAGVIGYSTLQGLRYMRGEIFRWHPDVILIRFGWNDQLIRETTYRAHPEPRNAILRSIYWRILQSRFYAFMVRLLTTAVMRGDGAPPEALPSFQKGKSGPGTPRVSPDEYAFNLRLLVREAREHGAFPILLSAPMGVVKPTLLESDTLGPFLQRTGYASLEALLRTHARYNTITARVAREEKAPFLDLDAAFAARGRGQFFGTTDIIHPNRRGNWLVAQLVLEKLRALGIVPAGKLDLPSSNIRSYLEGRPAAGAASGASTVSATSRAISR